MVRSHQAKNAKQIQSSECLSCSEEPQFYRPKWCILHYLRTITLLEARWSNLTWQVDYIVLSWTPMFLLQPHLKTYPDFNCKPMTTHYPISGQQPCRGVHKIPLRISSTGAEKVDTCLEWCTQVGSLFFCCVFVAPKQEYDGATGYRRLSGKSGLHRPTYHWSRELVHNSHTA